MMESNKKSGDIINRIVAYERRDYLLYVLFHFPCVSVVGMSNVLCFSFYYTASSLHLFFSISLLFHRAEYLFKKYIDFSMLLKLLIISSLEIWLLNLRFNSFLLSLFPVILRLSEDESFQTFFKNYQRILLRCVDFSRIFLIGRISRFNIARKRPSRRRKRESFFKKINNKIITVKFEWTIQS